MLERCNTLSETRKRCRRGIARLGTVSCWTFERGVGRVGVARRPRIWSRRQGRGEAQREAGEGNGGWARGWGAPSQAPKGLSCHAEAHGRHPRSSGSQMGDVRDSDKVKMAL